MNTKIITLFSVLLINTALACDHCSSLNSSSSCNVGCEPCSGCICESYGVYSGGNCSCGKCCSGAATWSGTWNGSSCDCGDGTPC